MSKFNAFTRNAREDLLRLNEEEETSAAETAAIQNRNLDQLRMSLSETKDPRAKAGILAELERGRGTDFPSLDTGFQFESTRPRPAVNVLAPEQSGRAPFEFITSKKTSDELTARRQAPGTEVGAAPPIGFQDTPGGAATGIRRARAGGDVDPSGNVPPWLHRVGIETAATALGGGIGGVAGMGVGTALGGPAGGRTLGVIGTRSGETGLAFLGSLLAETVDPTAKPFETATYAAGWTAATGIAATGGAAVLRRMLGKPTEAGKHILRVMEAAGESPPPGAVMSAKSLATTMQNIGSADAFFGKEVMERLHLTGMVLTRDQTHYLTDFYRYKKGAKKVFAEWDEEMLKLAGNTEFRRPIRINADVFDALEAALKEWERRGLAGRVDGDLLNVIRNVQATKAAGGNASTVEATLSEAESIQTFLYNQARVEAGLLRTETGQIGGKTFATANREMAEEVGQALEEAITRGVKQGHISPELRARLIGARELWRQWKQGETMLDELRGPLKASFRSDVPLSANSIKTAVMSIERQETKIGRPLISTTQKAHLAGVERALKAVEDSGNSGAFGLSVRRGQLMLLTGGVGVGAGLGGVAGAATAVGIALSPAAFTFIVTNPIASKLLINGLRLEPGTAPAVRVARELTTLLAKEGFTSIDRVPIEPEAE